MAKNKRPVEKAVFNWIARDVAGDCCVCGEDCPINKALCARCDDATPRRVKRSPRLLCKGQEV